MTEMLSSSAPTRKPLDFAWRVLVVALGFTLVTMIGGTVVGALRLPLPEPGNETTTAESLLVTFVAGLLMALVLGTLAARLALPRGRRAAVLLGVVFELGELINIVEALFCTTVAPIAYIAGLIVPLVGGVALALMLGGVFPPATVVGGLRASLRLSPADAGPRGSGASPWQGRSTCRPTSSSARSCRR